MCCVDWLKPQARSAGTNHPVLDLSHFYKVTLMGLTELTLCESANAAYWIRCDPHVMIDYIRKHPTFTHWRNRVAPPLARVVQNKYWSWLIVLLRCNRPYTFQCKLRFQVLIESVVIHEQLLKQFFLRP